MAFILLIHLNADASGLTTAFSEVTLENLEIGKSYSTKEVANLALEVVNTGKEEVDLKMELLMPQEQELKQGYEPIPSLSWIKLEKTEFTKIMPNHTAVTDVLISIPDQKEYKGKKYQAYIWSHTVGETVGVGLKSRLLIVIRENK